MMRASLNSSSETLQASDTPSLKTMTRSPGRSWTSPES